jgi:hypothetical protein
VDPVPDLLLPTKSGSDGNRTRDLCSQESATEAVRFMYTISARPLIFQPLTLYVGPKGSVFWDSFTAISITDVFWDLCSFGLLGTDVPESISPHIQGSLG